LHATKPQNVIFLQSSFFDLDISECLSIIINMINIVVFYLLKSVIDLHRNATSWYISGCALKAR